MDIERWEGSLLCCWEEKDKKNNYVLVGNNKNGWEENSAS